MTKVMRAFHGVFMWLLLVGAAATPGLSQDAPKPPRADSAESLYLQLRGVGLDKSRVYRVREVSVNRAAIHITLEDGVIGFTEDVMGRVTGAFFEGEGEILLTPPDQVERASMALFTGATILEERFLTAYFRFNDSTYAELLPQLKPADNAQEFALQWNQTSHNLAEGDALRLLMSFSQYLPASGRAATESRGLSNTAGNSADEDHFLHVRLQGRKLGVFDAYFDSNSSEQVWAGQLKAVESESYYNVWTSFSLPRSGRHSDVLNSTTGEEGKADSVDISNFKIISDVKPPSRIDAEALLQMQVHQGGRRAVLFELSRSLTIKQVEADGNPVEFIHNPAIEGTQMARRGNDLVAVIFPQPLQTGQRIQLRFVYGGEVLSAVGPGLLYVGDRGTWYPNRGLAMSNFDLEFHYPPGWTLVATGKRVGTDTDGLDMSGGAAGSQVSRWVSERPIPVAGFNLGKYRHAVAHAGEVTVTAYATTGVEQGFPEPKNQAVIPNSPVVGGTPQAIMITPTSPSPARNAQMVADRSARAIEFYSRHFGPYPYHELSLTQMPGNISQGWPGLIFLSSLSFLSDEEKTDLRMTPVQKTFVSELVGHETAHQWWGDSVLWTSYRDQWISEALANYSSLMLLESEDPVQFHAVMDKYRADLLEKNKDGARLMEDGAVTLGLRLSCSQFPSGYEAISYGRGTWLLHMLRYMLRDAESKERGKGTSVEGSQSADELFMRGLRHIWERYQGKPIGTRELLQAFEQELPRSLWYEGRKSLDWFYEGWVNGTAIPRFELRGIKYSDKPGSTTVSGTILQKDAPNDLVTPVPLYTTRAGKMVLLGRVFTDGPETPFHVVAPAGTRRVVLDPDQTLLTRVR